MKRLVGLLLLMVVIFQPLSAGASIFKSTYTRGGDIVATKPFRAFGNFSGIGDCQYETAANLILSRWPKVKISTAQVLSAWNTFGDLGDPTYTTTGLWNSQDFLMTTGFAGHHAATVTEIPQSAVLAAANNGGLEVVVLGPVRNHMFAIVASKGNQITIVDDGFVERQNLTTMVYDQTQAPGQQGEGLYFYGVTWHD
jgi:hypothetical protein